MKWPLVWMLNFSFLVQRSVKNFSCGGKFVIPSFNFNVREIKFTSKKTWLKQLSLKNNQQIKQTSLEWVGDSFCSEWKKLEKLQTCASTWDTFSCVQRTQVYEISWRVSLRIKTFWQRQYGPSFYCSVHSPAQSQSRTRIWRPPSRKCSQVRIQFLGCICRLGTFPRILWP